MLQFKTECEVVGDIYDAAVPDMYLYFICVFNGNEKGTT